MIDAWSARTALPTLSIHDRLAELVATHADSTFIVERRGHAIEEFSFSFIYEQTRRMAAVMVELGVRPGDRVHLALENRWEFVALLGAGSLVGAVIVPTHAKATVDDVAYVTSHADCVLSIASAESLSVVREAGELSPSVRGLITVDAVAASEGARVLHDLASAAVPVDGSVPASPLDPALILYTSGVTGWPKGVVLTRRNLWHVGTVVASHVRLRPDDRWLVTLPLSHLNALGYSLMSALWTGASVGFSDSSATWITAAQQMSATTASVFSIDARRALREPRQEDEANQVRLVLFGQHLTRLERIDFEQRFQTSLIQVYGSTESVAPTVGDLPYAGVDAESIGAPLAWTRVRVVRPDGVDVDAGEPGELLVSGQPGSTVAAGYHGRPEMTSETFGDGWLRTGDRVVQQSNGTLRFLGRAVDLLKPGVDTISAVEIERVLWEHVGVSEVAVVGVDAADAAEVIVAFVVLADEAIDVTEAELGEWASERLAAHKVPQTWFLVASLPHTDVGKIRKADLRAAAARRLRQG